MNESFFNSNAGKGTLEIFVAALLLIWPPAGAWIMAALVLARATTHLKAAFKEIDDAEAANVDRPVADAPEQRVDDPGDESARAGSPLDEDDARRIFVRGGGVPRQENRRLRH